MFSHQAPLKKNRGNQIFSEKKANILKYAQSGDIEQITMILSAERHPARRYSLRKHAVYGLSQHGNMSSINELISQEYDQGKLYGLQKCTIRGLAYHHHLEQAYAMLDEEKNEKMWYGLRKAMMAGFAEGRHFKQINEMLAQERDPDKLNALRQCAVGVFYQTSQSLHDEESVLCLVSQLADETLRELTMRMINKSKKSCDEKRLLTKAQKLHELMTGQGWDYKQAQAWVEAWSLPAKVQTWFLQVRPFLREQYNIPHEIFLHLSVMMMEQSERDVHRQFNNHFSIVPHSLFTKRSGSESELEAVAKLERRTTP